MGGIQSHLCSDTMYRTIIHHTKSSMLWLAQHMTSYPLSSLATIIIALITASVIKRSLHMFKFIIRIIRIGREVNKIPGPPRHWLKGTMKKVNILRGHIRAFQDTHCNVTGGAIWRIRNSMKLYQNRIPYSPDDIICHISSILHLTASYI